MADHRFQVVVLIGVGDETIDTLPEAIRSQLTPELIASWSQPYISPEDDYAAYWNQPFGADARAFAAYFTGLDFGY